jgi:Bacterial Ig domain
VKQGDKTKLFRTVLFVLIFHWSAAIVQAATPIGLIDGIDSAGVIYGWAKDPDVPNQPIYVHIYKDGPAGGGGKIIGSTLASVYRSDVGTHGFRYSLPPVSWDGQSHSYYVYGIDLTGDPNLGLSQSPQSATVQSTVVSISNGTMTFGIEPRCGGTIAQIIFEGVNLVNNYDCTGRQVQVAAYDGNGTYDSCAGCGGVWGWDPVQGGDRWNFGSVVIEQVVTGSSIYTKTIPHEWFPDNKGGGPGTPIASDMIIEQWLSFVPGEPRMIKMHSKMTHIGSDDHALANQEFPAVYVNSGFNRLMRYFGNSPWTGAAISETQIQEGAIYGISEKWAALVDSSNKGLTVYIPGQYPWMFGANFFDPNSQGGPFDNSTQYFTPFTPAAFSAGAVLEGDIYLIAGDYRQARQTIYNLQASSPSVDYLGPYGFMDQPTAGSVLQGDVTMSGWALDDTGVTKVDVLVDGQVKGSASSGQSRPDIPAAYPRASSNAGWSYTLDTTKLANGQRVISVRAYDAQGNGSTLTKAISVTVNNPLSLPPPPPPPPPPGDTIAPTVSISGYSVRRNYLDASVSASDNVGVTKVEIWIDGKLSATDSSNPYSFQVNVRSLSRGNHSFIAKAYDAAGNVGSTKSATFRR